MKRNVALKLAGSTLVLGLTMVGCKPAATRPASASSEAPRAADGAAKAYAQAYAKVQKGETADALPLAERAVELSPRDAGYRMLLADLYLKNGRFASAEAAYGDVLSIDPKNQRAALARTLMLIGQGKTGEAQIELDRLAAFAPPADVGLALALAGQSDRAIEMLEPAARAPQANGRVRQNLALAYALAGDWGRARVVASQDLSPAEVGNRLRQWAAFSNPSAPHLQVAAVLGVTAAPSDAGQPVRLALVRPSAEPQAYAEAAVPTVPTVLAAAGGPLEAVQVQPDPVPPVVAVAQAEVIAAPASTAEAYSYEPPAHGDVFAAPVQVAAVKIPVTPRRAEIVEAPRVFAAVNSLVEAPAVMKRASARISKAPLIAFKPVKPTAPRAKALGRYVVQIGAYKNAVQVEQAWSRAHRRYDFAGGQPLSTTITLPGKGTLHRLAVSGYDNHNDAARLCQSIRGKGGTCFVRATAGDSPLQWASRNPGRRA
jgi:Flp pilus assembly protein TadD